MTNYNISDKDFVPYVLSHNCFQEEEEKDLYQIVYGVFQKEMTYDKVYDLVVRVSKEQKNDIVKRYKLESWIEEINTILRKLRRYEAENSDVWVVIPFIDGYENSVQHTIKLFDFVLHVLKCIMKDGDANLEIQETPSYTYPTMSLSQLFVVFLFERMDVLASSGKDTDEQDYWASIIIDEMIRRGYSNYMPEYKVGSSFYKKSSYYNQPQLFFETTSEKAKLLKIKNVEDPDEGNKEIVPGTFEAKGKVKEQAKIIYYILKSIAEEKSDDLIRHKQIAFINYLFGEKYDVKEAKDNNIRRYVDEFRKITPESKEYSFYKRVKDKLDAIGIGVPEVIKKGLSRNELTSR